MTPTVLRLLLAINGIASAAAAVVLAIAPTAIPGTVGIPLDASQYFIAYLLGASELAMASLCAHALIRPSSDSERQAIAVLIVFHLASAAAGIAAWMGGASRLIIANVLVRIVMIALLAAFRRQARRS